MNKKRDKSPENQKRPSSVKGKAEQKHYKSIHFKEAIGKTIASFEQIIMDEDGGWNLEIFFTDGTALVLDLTARLQVQVQFLKPKGGSLENVRTYRSEVG